MPKKPCISESGLARKRSGLAGLLTLGRHLVGLAVRVWLALVVLQILDYFFKVLFHDGIIFTWLILALPLWISKRELHVNFPHCASAMRCGMHVFWRGRGGAQR